MITKHRYGWKKDSAERLAGHPLFRLAAPRAVYVPVNLRGRFPLPPFDQGDLGSCTANAIDGLRTFDLAKNGEAAAAGSRLFQYYNERLLEGDTAADGGATIADAVEAWREYGICAETEWPYAIARFAEQPPEQCYKDAKGEGALLASRVEQGLAALYACLAAGFPVIFGISVYESFESEAAAASGVIPVPKVHAEELLGGHAIVLCGMDVGKNEAYFRNSWGTSWGDGGYGVLPLREYLLNADLASDFWVVRGVGAVGTVRDAASGGGGRGAGRVSFSGAGLTALVVGGFLERVGDGSRIWGIGDALEGMGCAVVRRAWDGLAAGDLAGVDVVVDYSWGKAAVWDAMNSLAAEDRPTIGHEFTIAGVPCPLFGQFDMGGTLWTIPGNILAATDFQVDSFPISCAIRNASERYVNVNCDAEGVNHVTIAGLATVRGMILEGVGGMAEVILGDGECGAAYRPREPGLNGGGFMDDERETAAIMRRQTGWNRVCWSCHQEVRMKRPHAARPDDDGFFNEMDVTQALRGWAFQPGQVNVRLIRGNDGKPKLQLRLDLGLLQMELDGRPDGRRPHRAATELAFHQRKLGTHCKKHGNDSGFHLTPRECQSLREESAMFYHRYLSMFVLEQYESVIRDTQHNLDVLDLCRRYGRSDYDRGCLEQYRPYIMMMNTRAKACEALRLGFVQTAIAYLRGGIRRVAHLLPKEGRKELLRQSHEAHILLDMLKQIRSQLPPDPRQAVQKLLKEALAAERYEEAAGLRDQLTAMSAALAHPVAAKAPVQEASREEDGRPGGAGMPSGMPKAKGVRPRGKRALPRQKKSEGDGEGQAG